tara:strand:+ start:6856 stop:7428 length:573 start_codon:yes stop_codon:yes gene_type:complete
MDYHMLVRENLNQSPLKDDSMAKSTQSSEPHRRTRNDHKTETAEDYVEAIADILNEQKTCRLSDLAKRFSVSHVTVHRIVDRLQNEGLLLTEPYQPIILTSQGKCLASKCQQRHEIVYRFLLAIGIDEVTAAIDAEGIEHHVSPATLERFQELAEIFLVSNTNTIRAVASGSPFISKEEDSPDVQNIGDS